MSKALEKKTAKSRDSVRGYEVECRLFVYHTLKLFPDIKVDEVRRFIAKHVHVLVSYDWCRIQISDIKNSQDWLRDFGEDLAEKKFVQENRRATESAALITVASRKQVAKIVEDSQAQAKSIKGKLLTELETRLDGDAESFTNDETIRGAKAMHDIEHDSDNKANVTVNLIDIAGGLDEFKQSLDELNKRKQATVTVEEPKPGGGETKADDGEVQEG